MTVGEMDVVVVAAVESSEVEIGVVRGVLSQVWVESDVEVVVGAEDGVEDDVELDDTGTDQTASMPQKSDRPSSSR